MPKQSQKLKAFDQGINSVDSHRDLADGQSPYAANVDVSSNGRLTVLGRALTSYKGTTGGSDIVPDAGYGLFIFKHDYTMLAANGTFTTPAQTATTYLCKANETGIEIFDYNVGKWYSSGNIVTFDNNANDILPIFYLVDGGVRICDANHIDEPVKYIGHVKRVLGSSASSGSIALNKWFAGNARITAPIEAAGDTPDASNTVHPFAFQVKNPLSSLDADAEATSFLNIAWEWEEDTDGISTWLDSTTYDMYVSALYDKGKQESPLVKVSTNNLGNNAGVTSSRLKLGIVCNWGANGQHVRARCSGARIYVADGNSSFGQIYQLVDIDFEKGIRKGEAPDYEIWDAFASLSNAHESPPSMPTNPLIFNDPPVGSTYSSNNGHYPQEECKAAFRCAAVVGRRVFIGAPALQTSSSGNVTKNDLLLKSGSNQFDKFPELNRVQAAVNDGDEIIQLMGFGQELLQFKKESLYVIILQGDVEQLKGQFKFMGIEKPYQAVQTPIGVFFINRSGLHLYSGKGIQTLTDGKISEKMWNWQEPSYASIGYDEKHKKILICRDTRAYNSSTAFDAKDGFVFDIVKMSFVEGLGIFSGKGKKSNIVNTPDGKVVYAIDGTSVGSATLSGTITHQWTGRYRLYGTNYGQDMWEAQRYPWKVLPDQYTTVGDRDINPPTSTNQHYIEWTEGKISTSGSTGFSTQFDKGDYFDLTSALDVFNSEFYRSSDGTTASATYIKIWSAGFDGQGSVNNTLRGYVKQILDNATKDPATFIGETGTSYTHTIDSKTWTLAVDTAGDIDAFRFTLSVTDSGTCKATGVSLAEWTNLPQGSDIRYFTKDFDFGDAATDKKISKIYVNFRSVSSLDAMDDLGISTASNVKVQANLTTENGHQTVNIDATASSNYDSSTGLTPTNATNGFVKATLVLDDQDTNGTTIGRYVDSVQLVFYRETTGGMTPGGFEVNDVSISFSAKSIK